MFDRRLDNGCGSRFAIEEEGVAAFVTAPAVVVPTTYQMNHLPPILPDISRPQVPCLAVEGDSPRVANSVDPNFGACTLKVDERVIAWDRVGAFRL